VVVAFNNVALPEPIPTTPSKGPLTKPSFGF